jgi:hypothetical protein
VYDPQANARNVNPCNQGTIAVMRKRYLDSKLTIITSCSLEHIGSSLLRHGSGNQKLATAHWNIQGRACIEHTIKLPMLMSTNVSFPHPLGDWLNSALFSSGLVHWGQGIVAVILATSVLSRNASSRLTEIRRCLYIYTRSCTCRCSLCHYSVTAYKQRFAK